MSEGKEQSNLTFLHEVRNVNIHKGKKVVHEEEVIHGPKGLKFKYYHKEDDKVDKIVGVQKEDGSYVVITTVDGKRDEKSMSKDDVIKMLTKQKHLKFALDYIKTVKGGRKPSRKTSRAKRTSRKGSKRGSRKASGGKRRSRKASKKGSRRGSKK
jgi:hypothetical protein